MIITNGTQSVDVPDPEIRSEKFFYGILLQLQALTDAISTNSEEPLG